MCEISAILTPKRAAALKATYGLKYKKVDGKSKLDEMQKTDFASLLIYNILV